jgi:hypothetical protein
MTQFDPQTLIEAATRRPLRHGEAQALSLYITQLERARQAAIDHAASPTHVELSLATDGAAVNCLFPGAPPHSVRIPIGRADLAWNYITKALRERQAPGPKPIASPGAPTQADLAALQAAYKKPITKAKSVATLEDLGL